MGSTLDQQGLEHFRVGSSCLKCFRKLTPEVCIVGHPSRNASQSCVPDLGRLQGFPANREKASQPAYLIACPPKICSRSTPVAELGKHEVRACFPWFFWFFKQPNRS